MRSYERKCEHGFHKLLLSVLDFFFEDNDRVPSSKVNTASRYVDTSFFFMEFKENYYFVCAFV